MTFTELMVVIGDTIVTYPLDFNWPLIIAVLLLFSRCSDGLKATVMISAILYTLLYFL